MSSYIVIENENGLLVIGVQAEQTAEEAAVQHGGVIVDEGRYKTFEDAYDAMQLVPTRIDDGHAENQ